MDSINGYSGDSGEGGEGGGSGAGGVVIGQTYIEGRGGSGGNGCYSYNIDSTKEPETKAVCAAMGGDQPSSHEWDIFFMRHGGGMSSAIAEKMKMAHNVAKALPHLAGKSRPLEAR